MESRDDEYELADGINAYYKHREEVSVSSSGATSSVECTL
jgi:hypothetical protein